MGYMFSNKTISVNDLINLDSAHEVKRIGVY